MVWGVILKTSLTASYSAWEGKRSFCTRVMYSTSICAITCFDVGR